MINIEQEPEARSAAEGTEKQRPEKAAGEAENNRTEERKQEGRS